MNGQVLASALAAIAIGCGDGGGELPAGDGGPGAGDSGAGGDDAGGGDIEVVVFSATAGFRHGSIPDGIAMIEELGAGGGWRVSATEDAAELIAALEETDVVVFCNTTGDVLDAGQEEAFESFIRGGGGYVGVHSASDTEYDWPFYGELVGAWFDNHPSIQTATIDVEVADHPATAALPAQIVLEDEWYNFQSNPRGVVTVLATLDESTYSGGDMGQDHPIMWYRTLEAGRAFYTGLGHRSEIYAEPDFRAAIAGAIEWAAGR
jgi:type 1 glutamine amidotransferase